MDKIIPLENGDLVATVSQLTGQVQKGGPTVHLNVWWVFTECGYIYQVTYEGNEAVVRPVKTKVQQ